MRYNRFVGLRWENILELREMLTSLRNTGFRCVVTQAIVVVVATTQGNSNSMKAAILGLQREQQVSEYSAAVIRSFERDVFNTRFGISAIS